MRVELLPYQYDFVYSPARHPAFVGSWGVGKTMTAIARAMFYTKLIPENLGIIFRKTFKSLEDSTLKDFERYTGCKTDSHRNYTHTNGSIIMFRHIDELQSINQQNINLGWFYIEQGEELDSDEQFFMLFGRLRRSLTPTDEFTKLKLPLRSGWVIGNAGNNWLKELWKDGKLHEAQKQIAYEGKFSELIEAVTSDNQKNLTKDFLDSLKVIELTKPAVYKQYVLNDWNVSQTEFIMIRPESLEALKGITHHKDIIQRIISCDPSTGGDECVIYVIENGEILEAMILHENDTMKIAGHLQILGNKHKVDTFAIDSIGIGKGLSDRVFEMVKPEGKSVHLIMSADEASDKEHFLNKRAEMWWEVSMKVMNKEIPWPKDDELRKQLTNVCYEVINSKGRIRIEGKQKVKKRIGRSPDRADAFVYGISHLQYAEEIKVNREGSLDRYKLIEPKRDQELSVCNF